MVDKIKKGINIKKSIPKTCSEEEYDMLHRDIIEAYKPPRTLGAPKKVQMAMDNQLRDSNWYSSLEYMLTSMEYCPNFLGYQYLSNLCQNPIIKTGVELISSEMTRKFIELTSTGDIDITDKLKRIEKFIDDKKVRQSFKECMDKTCYYGGCLAYIDCGYVSREELKTPLILSNSKIRQGSFKGLKIVEPLLISPGMYNSTNPIADNYFKPETFWVQGVEIHRSRFLYFSENVPNLLLKPVYNFFGIPLAQIVLDYVVNFEKNRESVSRLLNKFSLTIFKSDLTNWLNGGDGAEKSISIRLDSFAKTRTNDGILLCDKELEDVDQLNTPLNGCVEILQQSLDLIPIIFGIPKMKFLQLQTTGLNGGETEYRNWNDAIHSKQETVFKEPIEKLLKVIQLSEFGEIDPNITFKFKSIWEMSETQIINNNRVKAETNNIYLANNVISTKEVRKNIVEDADSGYNNINIDEEVNNNPEEETTNTSEMASSVKAKVRKPAIRQSTSVNRLKKNDRM